MSRLPTNVLRIHDPYNAHLFEDKARLSVLQLIGDEYVPVPVPRSYEPVAREVIDRLHQQQIYKKPELMAEEQERHSRRSTSVIAAQIISAGELIKVARSRAGQGDVSASRELMASASGILRQLSDLNASVMRSPEIRSAFATVPDEFKSASQRLEVVHLAEHVRDDRRDSGDDAGASVGARAPIPFPFARRPREDARAPSDLMAA